MPDKRVFHSIQALRAFAAAVVALYHTQIAFERAAGTAPGFDTYLFRFGAVGVHIFFVISGFVMVTTTAGKTFRPGAFLRRRLLRIYPIYWICVAIYVAVYFAFGEALSMSTQRWIEALLLAPPGAGSIIGPGWTLAYEMFFYLCFMVAMSIPRIAPFVSQPLATAILAAVFLASIAARPLLPVSQNLWLNTMTSPLLLEFLGGAVLGWLLYLRMLPSRWGTPMMASGIATLIALILLDYDITTRVITMGLGSFLVVAGALALEAHGEARGWVRWFGKLGDSSYALYLIHIAVLAILVRWATSAGWVHAAPDSVFAIALLPFLIAVGEALHRSVERPLLAWLPTRSPFRFRRNVPTNEDATHHPVSSHGTQADIENVRKGDSERSPAGSDFSSHM